MTKFLVILWSVFEAHVVEDELRKGAASVSN